MSESPLCVQIPGPAADFGAAVPAVVSSKPVTQPKPRIQGLHFPVWLWQPHFWLASGSEHPACSVNGDSSARALTRPGGCLGYQVTSGISANFPCLLLPSLRAPSALRNPCCFMPDWLHLSQRTCWHHKLPRDSPLPQRDTVILCSREGYLGVAVFGIKVRIVVPSMSFRSLFVHTSLHTANIFCPLPIPKQYCGRLSVLLTSQLWGCGPCFDPAQHTLHWLQIGASGICIFNFSVGLTDFPMVRLPQDFFVFLTEKWVENTRFWHWCMWLRWENNLVR